MKYWEIIADSLSNAGWSWGCVSSIDHKGRQFWVVAAEREDARRFIVHADQMLTALKELETVTRNRQSTPATEKQERDSPPEIP